VQLRRRTWLAAVACADRYTSEYVAQTSKRLSNPAGARGSGLTNFARIGFRATGGIRPGFLLLTISATTWPEDYLAASHGTRIS